LALPVVSIERPALYVVATPLGNLADITLRALAVLRAVDVIYAEDTRLSHRLLEHYGIRTPARALHEHNEDAVATGLVAGLVERGEAAALISDAGTPLLSDPGYTLVRAAVDAGLPLRPVPGPSALTAALCVGGLPTHAFAFEGFLPAQAGARAARLRDLAAETRTMVFYEAPHRLEAMLADLVVACGGERRAVVTRELTKKFESHYHGTLAELAARFATETPRGEFVVLVGGNARGADLAEAARIYDTVLTHADARTALRVTMALTGLGRNAVYAMGLARRGETEEGPGE